MSWAGLVLGVIVVIATSVSLLQTLVVPRGFSSRLLIYVDRAIRTPFLALVNRFETYEAKDRLLALQGPTSLVVLLFAWLFLYFLGFALILWPLVGRSFEHALVESGSSMLTLGFVHPENKVSMLVSFAAAATGLVVIALEIAYLPAIYGSFNRRETVVTLLQSRSGAPAWGPEILARHHLVGLLDALPAFYAEWERWAADVAESHTNYPVLVTFRSPHPLRSWIVGLLAVLDSAALFLALAPERAPTEARLCLRMGFVSLRDIADTIGMDYEPDPFPDDPIELTFEEFEAGVNRLEEVGFPTDRGAGEAWGDFAGWRINYEQLAYAIADRVVAAPGPWSGTRAHLPGLTIVPQRPADRRRGDDKGEPRRSERGHWA